MIEIRNLTKKYDNVTVLKNTSYHFPSKGLVCLLGKSGSGKSTLLNILAGFDSDYTGDIIVDNTNISKMTSEELCIYRRDTIGFVFQNYHLLKGYTVLENIILPCELIEEEKDTNIQRAKELIKQLGIAGKENEKIEDLSGGQKQRVAIARALIINPNIILADEPTGALDRSNAKEIMEVLKQIAQERLVVVITHDKKISDFADEVISVEDGSIIIKEENLKEEKETNRKMVTRTSTKVNAFGIGMKNFKVHFWKFMAVSLAIAIGIVCFMLSLSFGNIMEQSIQDFKEKNTACHNGYIKSKEEADLFELLNTEERIENVYRQYKIEDITLKVESKSEKMAEKYPMPKATENMSYGIMPRIEKNEIALSPSLAKKFAKNINELIGKKLILNYENTEYDLTVSGIFNAGYDDFFVSSNVEQLFYKDRDLGKFYSISYDVKNFEEIVMVSNYLSEKKIESKNVAKEVSALQHTFQNLKLLFLTISILIMIISLFIGSILLFKLQHSRYKEIGLLSALGFSKKTIKKMMISENILLFIMTVIFNMVFMGILYMLSSIFTLPISISIIQIIVSSLVAGAMIVVISMLMSNSVVHTEPAMALKK